MGFDRGVSRIVVTGDFLRPIEASSVPAQTGNVHWLGHLVRRPLQLATGLPVEVRTWGGTAPADIGYKSIKSVYDGFKQPLSLDGWAKIYRNDAPAGALDALVSGAFDNALVIGFELPPVVETALRRAGIPFVAVAVHPARYMDDIILGMRCSDQSVQNALRARAIPELEFEVMAGIHAAATQKKSFFQPAPNSLVILGQMPKDASCISGGKFASLEDFRAEIAKSSAGRKVVYFKPHPFSDDKSVALRMRDDWGLPVETTDESIYYLMAHPHVAAVLALSSSVGVEARYFGKQAKLLLQDADRLWRSTDPAVPDAYIPQREDWLSPDFWRAVLAPAMQVTPPDGIRLAPKANRLRLSMGSFWGYNRTDTDLLVDMGTQPGTAAWERMQDLALAAAQQTVAELGAHVSQMDGTISAARGPVRDLGTRVTALETYLSRGLGQRWMFRLNGRPIRPLRRALFHSNGKPRGIFRSLVIAGDGTPRPMFRQWMTSPDYLRLPRAWRSSAQVGSAQARTMPHRPTQAWRSVLSKDQIDDSELDALMDRIRSELRDEAER